ncbi:hypothetical protein M407DRAFT_26565 [Tulasnella calospora MUT 4182]|uniref:Uncharacterized protein n=1 Tax=Tulasnella calospora MUT 4182 TaxID=1051891 RepID=A0A0C3Q4S3_9AGAM|nr:hypothetical protein M407DRAFT_26565 [Tulasnella calospora MUT 4182]
MALHVACTSSATQESAPISTSQPSWTCPPPHLGIWRPARVGRYTGSRTPPPPPLRSIPTMTPSMGHDPTLRIPGLAVDEPPIITLKYPDMSLDLCDRLATRYRARSANSSGDTIAGEVRVRAARLSPVVRPCSLSTTFPGMLDLTDRDGGVLKGHGGILKGNGGILKDDAGTRLNLYALQRVSHLYHVDSVYGGT